MDCQEQTSQPEPEPRPFAIGTGPRVRSEKLGTSSVRKFRLYLKILSLDLQGGAP